MQNYITGHVRRAVPLPNPTYSSKWDQSTIALQQHVKKHVCGEVLPAGDLVPDSEDLHCGEKVGHITFSKPYCLARFPIDVNGASHQLHFNSVYWAPTNLLLTASQPQLTRNDLAALFM